MAVAPPPQLQFSDFFQNGKWLWWYLPMSPYAQFEKPSTGLELTVRKILSIVVIGAVILILVSEFWFLWTIFNSDQPIDFVVCASSIRWIFFTIMGLDTTTVVIRKCPQLLNLLQKMAELFPTTDQTEAREQFAYWKLVLNGYSTVYGATMLSMCFSPLLIAGILYLVTGEWTFEFSMYVYYPFDEYSPQWVLVAYVWQIWVILGSTLCMSAVVVLIGVMTQQMGLQYKKLANEFARLTLSTNNYAEDRLKLVCLMQKHNELMDIGQEMHDVYTLTLVVNYLLSSMVICLYCFLIATIDDVTISLQFAIEVGCFFLYNSLYSLFGQELIDNSSRIGQAIYNSDWCYGDVRLKQIMVLIMLRASKPDVLTGMGFFVICLQSQAKILTTSYSYFTLLRSSYNK